MFASPKSVLRIAALAAEGKNPTYIAAALNREGFLPPSRRPEHRWHDPTVRDVLRAYAIEHTPGRVGRPPKVR